MTILTQENTFEAHTRERARGRWVPRMFRSWVFALAAVLCWGCGGEDANENSLTAEGQGSGLVSTEESRTTIFEQSRPDDDCAPGERCCGIDGRRCILCLPDSVEQCPALDEQCPSGQRCCAAIPPDICFACVPTRGGWCTIF